ncbi:PREDICTED: vacuolar protein sorting-associated protein 8 homolog isoform X2 [Nelumbo nucifera]|uniref:Vacuolar protein sorting-associated protein 8 homolog isoform X2 n=1 Tax=Nelumbo nucifera TaxID=4432 RepID=A0A1U7ZIY8_NELNU|nr:PREDICTED: vacuolar protein sorting-associated protein 8 homolog isoform X2 [Nelumbo nucifera]
MDEDLMMTEMLSRPSGDLDLDSFLQIHSSSDDDDLSGVPHRTVDEILNDSDSSSSSSSTLFDSAAFRRGRFSNIPTSGNNLSSFPKEESQIHDDDASVCSHESLSVSRISIVDETLKSREALNSAQLEEKSIDSNTSSLRRIRSDEPSGNTFSLGRSASRPFSPLFGGVKANPKPGAALAAAAAASRSIPTPHAAAIKSRRASSSIQRKLLHTEELDNSVGELNTFLDGNAHVDEPSHSGGACDGFGSGIILVGRKLSEEDEKVRKFPSSSAESIVLEFCGGDEVTENSHESNEVSCLKDMQIERAQASESDGTGLLSQENLSNLNSSTSTSIVEPQATSPIGTAEVLDTDEKSEISNSTNIKKENHPSFSTNENAHKEDLSSNVSDSISLEKDIPSSPRYEKAKRLQDDLVVQGLGIHDSEKSVSSDTKDGEVSFVGDDTSSRSGITELVEDKFLQLESKRVSKKTAKKLRPSKKPLELAEELEKKHASSGLHWEEGAAAQPMRLEGIRRGPPAVGYLHIDPDNAITRAISSQAFRRDHGSPQVLAVHANFIAVGMSKGVIIVVPSKYSAHSADNMDYKMSILGAHGEKSHSPVTSMCFNQQGDLLLAGYGDGHITVWDVQREAVAKVITGGHTAPVVHTLFLGQDSQVTRQFKAVTGDCKGLVLLHAFSVFPLFNKITIKTQCLLDGQRTGTVLTASPLLLYESHEGNPISAQGNATTSASGIGSMMGGVVGGVVGGEAGWKILSEGSSLVDEGVVIFVTHQTALVARLSPTLEVYAQLSKPDGVREGSMPYTAWKCMTQPQGSSTESFPGETFEKVSLLAIAWDRKIQVAKLVKSELKIYKEWTLDSVAIGVQWLDDQMLVVLTLRGQLCLFAKEGTELHRTSFAVDGSGGVDIITYHTYFTNVFGNPEKAYHNCVAARGASIYMLGPMHLVVSRLLPWKERIQVLRRAGDWMGALDMAMRLYDGHAHGVIDLPRTLDAIQETIMPYLVELLLSYVDEVFSYISVAFCNQIEKVEQVNDPKSIRSSVHSEMEEQFARVGGVAVEFCVHIKRIDILFDDIFSKFMAVKHGGTFLELLEPYILKDMLGCLPPEIMQALVEHYSEKGWLQRVEQCVLHMDISSLDFNQVVRLCQEHGLYGALIYLFNRGLDDFKAPLEELLQVLRNSQGDDAVAIGYRILVYLKYCFSGLAFPPGHGSIPPTRLPSLRAELMQFLIEDSNDLNSEVVAGTKSSTGTCPNLYPLLLLDTEATLQVISCAFLEEEVPRSDHSFHGSDTNSEDVKENDPKIESLDLMVQNTVDTLIHILDLEISEVERSSGIDDTGYPEIWPSKKDMAHLLEFIAYFVACKQATVSKSVLSHILEYLTSESSLSLSVHHQKTETLKRREKHVIALLKVVPETNWDSSYVLHLCEKAEFHQVCGLIHARRGQYIAALDSYLKDTDEPIHAFSFINDMLRLLRDTESTQFQSAVISRIPDLVNLSREGAFFLVIEHFNKEYHQILAGLRSHPKSLFLYLKTIIEIHLAGTLNFSSLEKGDNLDVSCGKRLKDHTNGHEAYLARISDFPKLLRQNPVHVTDEMIELYLELLCQYERQSVLKFLETFESYRVEHCLRLCQEYGVIDAAAFLLERVGDVGSALLLTLSGLNEKFTILDAAVERIISDIPLSGTTEIEQLNSVLRMEEVDAIHDILQTSIGLCQRNTQRLDPNESESLWFHLLDSFCEPLKDSYDSQTASEGGNHVSILAASFGTAEDKGASMNKWRISNSHRGAHVLRRVISQFIRKIVEGMIGYVRLPTIMTKLLSDNGGQEFGDFKLTILGMLGTYGFERRILVTAKSLIEDDTFYTMSLLKKGASHGYAPQSLLCCLCNSVLSKESSSSSIRVFNCGHATHLQCEFQENEALEVGSSVGCPVCMPKKKSRQSRSKSVHEDSGLVKSSLSRTQHARGTTIIQHPYEPEALEKPYGLQQISRFEILNNLQKGKKSVQLENLPQLRLVPPAIYHEKVKKGMDIFAGESSSTPPKGEKPSKSKQFRELKMKGSTLRFPLRSNIFEKRTKR